MALRSAGRYDEARQALLEAVALSASSPGVGATRLSDIHVSLGLVESWRSDHVAAEAAYRRAVELADANVGANSPSAAYKRLALGQYLANSCSPGEGIEWISQARRTIESWPEESPERQREWLPAAVLEARTLRQFGRLEASLALLDRSRSIVDQAERAPTFSVLWHTARAETLTELGRFGEASQALEQARALARQHGMTTSTRAREIDRQQMRLDLASGRLDEAGRAIEAMATSSAARALWTTLTGTRAQLMLARGQCTDAEAQLGEAMQGATLSTRRQRLVQARFLWMLGRARLCLGRSSEAVAPLRQASDIADQSLDPGLSLDIAAICLALSDALKRDGANREARDLLVRAEQILAAQSHQRVALLAEASRLRRLASRRAD